MELQRAKLLCKLTEDELNEMIRKAFVTLTKDQTDLSKKAIYSLGYESYNRAPDTNGIDLDIRTIESFNPYHDFLNIYLPNIAHDVMYEDCLNCLSKLIPLLVQGGYNLLIHDIFLNADITKEILYYLKDSGYDVRIEIIKVDLYYRSLRAIFEHAISIIAKNRNSVEYGNISLQMIVGLLKSGVISGIGIRDILMDECYALSDKDEVKYGFIINKSSNYTEPQFYNCIQRLTKFITDRQRFFTKDEFNELLSEIEYVRTSAYKEADISFLKQESSR